MTDADRGKLELWIMQNKPKRRNWLLGSLPGSIERSKKRVLLLPDSINWAWGHRSRGLQRYAPPEYSIDITVDPSDKTYEAALSFPWFVPRKASFCDRVVRLWTFVASESCLHKHHPRGDAPFPALTASEVANVDTARHLLPRYHGVITINRKTVPFVESVARRCQFLRTGVDHHLYRPALPPQRNGPLRVGWCGKAHKDRWVTKGYRNILLPLMNRFDNDPRVQFVVNTRDARSALTQEEMVTWFSSIDVLLITSCVEGTPSVALEAMSCGRAVVAPPVGVIPELVREKTNGILLPNYSNSIEAETVVENAHAVLRGLLLQRDLVVDMGAEARRTIEVGWTWEELAPRWLRALCEE